MLINTVIEIVLECNYLIVSNKTKNYNGCTYLYYGNVINLLVSINILSIKNVDEWNTRWAKY